MAGLLRRLFGKPSPRADEAPPEFTLELPDGWAGGYGPVGYLEALVEYARAHPECHDRAYELIRAGTSVEGLYLAGDTRGDAQLVVTAEALSPGGWLTPADELDAYARGTLAAVKDADFELVGEPTLSVTELPPGRVLRWIMSFDGPPPIGISTYAYATAGRIWSLEFSTDAGLAGDYDEVFSALASSLQVRQPPPQAPDLPPLPARPPSESVESAVARLVESGGSMRVINESSWAALRLEREPAGAGVIRLAGRLVVRSRIGSDVIDALELAGFSLAARPVDGSMEQRLEAARTRAVGGYSRYDKAWFVPPDVSIDIAADVRAAFTAILGRVPAYLAVASAGIYGPGGPDLDIAAEPDGVDADAYVMRGIDRVQDSDLVGAIADFDQAIELEPGDAFSYCQRADAQVMRGDFEAALVDAETAVALEPTFQDAYYSRAFANAYLGEDDLAIADYTRVIELDPDDFLAYNGRASASLRQGHGQAALADAEWLVGARPEMVVLYALRGWAKAVNNDQAGAIADFHLAGSMTEDPDDIGTIMDIQSGLGL